jgi:hypothetical protein
MAGDSEQYEAQNEAEQHDDDREGGQTPAIIEGSTEQLLGTGAEAPPLSPEQMEVLGQLERVKQVVRAVDWKGVDWNEALGRLQQTTDIYSDTSRQRTDRVLKKQQAKQQAADAKARFDLEKQQLLQQAADAKARFDLEKQQLLQQAADAKARFDLETKVHDLQAQKDLFEATRRAFADRSRGIVLYLVVLAVVLMPVLAMGWFNIRPAEFSQYVAPITGIAGTVLGYWFGRQDQRT